MASKEDAFRIVLSAPRIDVPLLKKLCCAGVPPAYRLTTYQVVLEVLGPRPDAFAEEARRQKERYRGYLGRPGAGRHRVPAKIEAQIEIDIRRIGRRYREQDGTDVSGTFSNVLRITASKRPYIGYTQGMADLVVPFLHLAMAEGPVAEHEHTVYFCYSSLIGRIQRDIMNMQARLLCRLEAVLLVVARDVLDALDRNGLQLYMICFRWFGCLFLREFEIECWYRIFDSMVSDDIGEFSIFFGAALLLWFREPIVTGDFASIMVLMQSIQEQGLTLESVENLIGSAAHLRREYSVRLAEQGGV